MSDKPEFPLIQFNDIHHPTGINYVIRGLIPREGLVLVYGPPKCGKSFLIMDMMLHVALNWNYRGRKVKTGSVVYIACEGVSGITARVEAFRQNKLQDECGPIPFYLLPARVDLVLRHVDLATSIAKDIGNKPINIIVIDTLNRSLRGDENNSSDMGNYIKAADYLREHFQCAVILIHHSGYDATHARGHTSLPAAIDAQIAVKKDKETGLIIATLELMKDGDMGEEYFSRLEKVDIGLDDEGDTMTSCVVYKADAVPASTQKKPPSGNKKMALDTLNETISESGTYPPATCNRIPAVSRIATYDEWREAFYHIFPSEDNKPDAKRMAFTRAASALQSDGLIKIWDKFVWIP